MFIIKVCKLVGRKIGGRFVCRDTRLSEAGYPGHRLSERRVIRGLRAVITSSSFALQSYFLFEGITLS